MIPEFFEWLSWINLYPYYDAWNVVGVFLFLVWIFWAFIHLRPKLGILKGGVVSLFIAFTYISVVDEIQVFLGLNWLVVYRGWNWVNFLSRWSWKIFFVYWSLKIIAKHKLFGNEIRITETTVIAMAFYWGLYFMFHFRVFYPYNFRQWYLTPYPRWFMFAAGHCAGWMFSTVIFLSIWWFDMPKDKYLETWGIGEVYMLYALRMRLEKLRSKYNLRAVGEFETTSASEDFPGRDWAFVTSYDEIKNYDLVYVFRPHPELISNVVRNMSEGMLLMIACTNKDNLGYYSQRLLNIKGEWYANKEELEIQMEGLGLEFVESGYFDSPFWFDHSTHVIVPTRKLGIDQELIKRLLVFERFNGNKYMAHHAYVVGRVN